MIENPEYALKLFQNMEENCIDIPNRIVYLIGDIVSGVVESVVQQIRYLSSTAYFSEEVCQKPISLVVNSCGGHDDMMLYLYDAITLSKAEIHTVGTGMCCSAAALVLVSGDKRYCTPHAWFMTHKGHAILEGDDDEIVAQAELSKKMSERYWKLLSRHTKHSAQWWYNKSRTEGELWLDAEDMLKYGVVDEIIAPTRRELEPLSNRKLKNWIPDAEEDIEAEEEEPEPYLE